MTGANGRKGVLTFVYLQCFEWIEPKWNGWWKDPGPHTMEMRTGVWGCAGCLLDAPKKKSLSFSRVRFARYPSSQFHVGNWFFFHCPSSLSSVFLGKASMFPFVVHVAVDQSILWTLACLIANQTFPSRKKNWLLVRRFCVKLKHAKGESVFALTLGIKVFWIGWLCFVGRVGDCAQRDNAADGLRGAQLRGGLRAICKQETGWEGAREAQGKNRTQVGHTRKHTGIIIRGMTVVEICKFDWFNSSILSRLQLWYYNWQDNLTCRTNLEEKRAWRHVVTKINLLWRYR